MAALNWEVWQRLPDLRAGCCGRRGSGDEQSWEHVMRQSEAPPRRARPQSCIEAGTGWQDAWLHHLERMRSSPAQNKVPALSERTVSTPSLEVTNRARQCRSDLPASDSWSATPRRACSLRSAPLCGRDVSSPRWHRAAQPLGYRETARYKMVPSGEAVASCCLSAVRSSWLPTQQTALLCTIPGHATCVARDSAHMGSLKSDTRAKLAENVMKKNDFGEAGGGVAEPRWQWADPVALGSSSPADWDAVRVSQVSEERTAVMEGPLSEGQEGRLKTWEGIHRDDAQAVGWALPGSSYLLYRRVSAPECSPMTASPGISSSPSPKARTGFSSITIASRRVPQGASADGTFRGSTPIKLSSISPLTDITGGQPVVRRRKATVIKVTECRQSYAEGQGITQICPPTFRHSYAGMEKRESDSSDFATNHVSTVWHSGVQLYNRQALPVTSTQSGPSTHSGTTYHDHTQSDPSHSGPTHPDSSHSDPTQSALSLSKRESPGDGKTKVHRSTVSLFLRRSSSGDAAPDRRGGALERPGRPLSFTGDFGRTDIGLREAVVAEPRRASLELPSKTNIDSAGGTACSTNMHVSLTGLQPNDVGPPPSWPCITATQGNKGVPAHVGAFRRGYPPPADHGCVECWCPDSTLTINAASVIANIKWQTHLNKVMGSLQDKDREKPHEDREKPHEDREKPHEDREMPHECMEKLHERTGAPGKDKRTPPPAVCPLVKGNVIIEKAPQDGNAVDQKFFYAEGYSTRVVSHPEPLETSQTTLTLKEALERFRPDFIRRSRGRVRELEQRAWERRARQDSGTVPTPIWRHPGKSRTRPNPGSDSALKPGQRGVTGERVLLTPGSINRSYKKLHDAKKKKEEAERKKMVAKTNRLRAEIFKKNLLDQILQRKSD